MEEWKQAWKLAKYEVKAHGILFYFLFVLSFMLLAIFASEVVGNYLEKGVFLVDIGMLLVPISVIMWMKAKPFQYQLLKNNFWGTPYFIMLYSLAIPKNVLIKSRFINYFIWSLPFHLLFFLFTYLFSVDIREFFTVGEYLVFTVVWISYGFFAGSLYPASDAGDYISNLKLIIYGILMVVGLLLVVGGIRFSTGHGLVYWTMMAAKVAPIWTSLFAIVIAFIGVKYWLSYMGRQIEKTDYF